jgi:hypothetical protein
MVRLVACAGCARHVKSDERACPFCGHDLTGIEPRPLAPLPSELTRAAALFLGATALTGCGKEPAPPPPPPVQEQMAVPAYGPPMPAPTLAQPVADAAPPPIDAGAKPAPNAVPAYGVPPPDRVDVKKR